MQKAMILQKVYKALIDEDRCIGCAKCSRTCPTDAIVGAKRMLHTVITQYCTACGRCIDACPTNCISATILEDSLSEYQAEQLMQAKQTRLSESSRRALDAPPTILFSYDQHSVRSTSKPSVSLENTNVPNDMAKRKQSVADAIARARAKKNPT